MLDGISNSGQKRLQIYAPWNGQSGTGSSISAQNTEIGDLLGGVKLPTKEQLEASLKKVQPQSEEEFTQKVQKYFEEQAKKDNEQNNRIMPYFPNLTEPEEKLIDPNSDLGKKIAKVLDDLQKNPQLIQKSEEKLIDPNSDLGKKIAGAIDSRNNSPKLMLFPSLADDYVPVYKPVTDTDGKQMGPWPEYVLVGYRAKTDNEKKGVELQ